MNKQAFNNLAVVAIGRNEGQRLRLCLESVADYAATVVYVDSGSTDDSVELAESLGAHVVQLDQSVPFTAARARNIGIEHANRLVDTLEYVQVIDGDCELNNAWIDRAMKVMLDNPKVAIVCGRRRERYPDRSVYNRLIDMEWDTPIGKASSCGGDALIRLEAYYKVGGYNASLIAGEEPEMCFRLRDKGWEIERIAAEMTLHDADVHEFGLWFRRSVRSGYAFAMGKAMHGRSSEQYCVHEVKSIVQWALLLPAIALMLSWITWGVSLLLLGGYYLLYKRVRNHRKDHGDQPQYAELYARYIIIGKYAQLTGCMRYWYDQFLGRKGELIEYKNTQPQGA